MAIKMNDKKFGIYEKFRVSRTDGSSGSGKKHEFCSYFVLDYKHDPYVIPALKAYSKACKKEYPELSDDINNVIKNLKEINKKQS